MNPPATPYTWTYSEYARFPDDGNRYEVIDGEVLVTPAPSPTSSSNDRVKKPRRYGDFGVPEYWVLDPIDAAVWIWRFAAGAREPERLQGSFVWQPAAASEPLVLDTAELFRPL